MTNIRVANRDELPPGKGKVVEVGERRVTIYNLDGRFHATATRRARPHNPIAETDCSLHGHVFDVYAEDSPARVRAEMEVYAVRLRGGTIWLELPTTDERGGTARPADPRFEEAMPARAPTIGRDARRATGPGRTSGRRTRRPRFGRVFTPRSAQPRRSSGAPLGHASCRAAHRRLAMRKRLFIFLATWMTACTAAAPSVTGPGAAGKADGVDTNTSENLASLTVQAPSAGDAQLTFRRSPMPLGQAVMLAPGGGCLSISSSFFRVPFDVSCNLMLDSAKPTTVALATLRTSWDRTSVTTDFGAAAAVESVSLDGRTVATRAPDGALVPPGHYGFSFNYGVLGEVQATVTAGADQTADLTVPDVRATVTLVPPSRLYPDPTPTDCEEPARHALVRRRGDPPPGINEPALHLGGIFERTTSTTAVEYSLFDLPSKTSFRILPLTTREKPDRYELVVNNMVEPLALTPGASLNRPRSHRRQRRHGHRLRRQQAVGGGDLRDITATCLAAGKSWRSSAATGGTARVAARWWWAAPRSPPRPASTSCPAATR